MPLDHRYLADKASGRPAPAETAPSPPLEGTGTLEDLLISPSFSQPPTHCAPRTRRGQGVLVSDGRLTS